MKVPTRSSPSSAHAIGTRLELDATDNETPDEDAVRWVKDWMIAL